MKNKVYAITFLIALMCTWTGEVAAQCEVMLHQDSPPGGRQLVIRQSEFPLGVGMTFWAPENTWTKSWNRATSFIENAVQGNFSTSDLLWAGSFALNMKKAVLNEIGQNTIGYKVGSLTHGNLIARIDEAGNILGIETGTEVLTPEGLYNRFYPGDWGPTDWNDEISSVSFRGSHCSGSRITLFWDKEFAGQSVTYGPGTTHLESQGWNDAVSSFKVDFPPPTPKWVQYGSENVLDVAIQTPGGPIVWEIERSPNYGRVYRYVSSWEDMTFNLPKPARKISFDPAGQQAWVVLEDDSFWYLPPGWTQWQRLGTGLVHDATGDHEGKPWISEKTPEGGHFYHMAPDGSWIDMQLNLPRPVRSISNSNGIGPWVWVVLDDDTFWYLHDGAWVQYGGGHVYDMVPDTNGLPWIVEKRPADGNVYQKMPDGSWRDMQLGLPRTVRSIALSATTGLPWVVLDDGRFFYLEYSVP